MARLKHSDFFNLCKWLEASKPYLLSAKPKQWEIAEKATSELGFEYNQSQVSEALKATNIYELIALPSAKGQKQANQSKRELRILIHELQRFFERAGHPVSAEFANLFKEYSRGNGSH